MQYRDLSLFEISSSEWWVTACDTAASIGEKEHDVLKVKSEIVGALTLRVALFELLCVGAQPELLLSLSGNEWEPYGRDYNKGIFKELEKLNMTDVEINGSTEENMRTSMSSLGVVLSGRLKKYKTLMYRVKPQDKVFQVGAPYVGEEVMTHFDQLITYTDLLWFKDQSEVHELVPIGSKGSLNEAQQVAEQNGYQFILNDDIKFSDWLGRSGGPATSILVIGDGSIEKKIESTFKNYMLLGEMRKFSE